MGCVSTSPRKITGREKNFQQKSMILYEQFSELKGACILLLDRFQCSFENQPQMPLSSNRFPQKDQPKKDSYNSSDNIDVISNNILQNAQQQNANNITTHSPTKIHSKNETLVNFQNQEEITAPTNPIVATLTQDAQAPPNYSEMVNIDSVLACPSFKIQFDNLRGVYEVCTISQHSIASINDLCRVFSIKFEEILVVIEELIKQAEILHKCLRAFKDEIPGQLDKKSIFKWLPELSTNGRILSTTLRTLKHNLSQFSLFLIVKETSNSLMTSVVPTPVN